MLYSVVIFQLVVSIIANPLHKYPFVFLLDVGNEELEKTNTEQIRVSVPGGSLAVRYPAVGDGDLITHARVSGIDFGTDLKANILDGGPGYKYIVLVFLGNKGIPYDAVITLQMLPSSEGSSDNSMSQNSEKGDVNNSAEDMDDVSNEVKHSDGNAELAQPSSNLYNYAQVVKDCENDDAFDNTDDIHVDNSRDSVENDVTDGDNEDDKYQAEKLQAVSKDDVYNDKDNNNLIDNAEMNQDLSSDEDAKMYRQDTIYDAQGHSPLSDDPVELDQMFNDEEIHNDADKFKDSNNNNFDLDYDTAVAY